MTHRIVVERNTLRFAAAHFTTFGGQCEPLHGHNYDVTVEVEGSLTGNSWVMDFRKLKRMAAALCKELDHRFLLPLHNPHLEISETQAEYRIRFRDRLYVIPRSDVAALTIENSTTERLAQWLAERLAQEIRSRNATNLSSLTVGVEESPGQRGYYTLPLATNPSG